MKRITRWLIACLVILLLVSAAGNVAAEELSKTYTLQMSETQGSIGITPETPAFWEYPVFYAGEDHIEGTMTVKNASNYTATMTLLDIALPYGDEQRMGYLDQLLVTVKEGDTVLFDNTYSHINDAEGGLQLHYENMAPGEEHTYTIKMRCLYTYAGDPNADAVTMLWNFSARGTTTTYEGPEGLPEWVEIALLGLAATIALLIFITIIRAIVRFIKRKKKPVDK